MNNYRPISLLSCISKILEKIMYRRLTRFFIHQNFFYDLQFGFWKNYSTSDAITFMIDKISKAFDQKEMTLAIFLDLSKAFDSINHSILLQKLSHFGIRGSALDRFESYLDNRFQKSRQPCYAQPIQAKLIPDCKDSFLHCFTWTSRLHLFSRLCPIFGMRLAPNNDTQWKNL